jgi:hypothetical protein
VTRNAPSRRAIPPLPSCEGRRSPSWTPYLPATKSSSYPPMRRAAQAEQVRAAPQPPAAAADVGRRRHPHARRVRVLAASRAGRASR